MAGEAQRHRARVSTRHEARGLGGFFESAPAGIYHVSGFGSSSYSHTLTCCILSCAAQRRRDSMDQTNAGKGSSTSENIIKEKLDNQDSQKQPLENLDKTLVATGLGASAGGTCGVALEKASPAGGQLDERDKPDPKNKFSGSETNITMQFLWGSQCKIAGCKMTHPQTLESDRAKISQTSRIQRSRHLNGYFGERAFAKV